MVPKTHESLVVHRLVDGQHGEILHFDRRQSLRQTQRVVVDDLLPILSNNTPKGPFFLGCVEVRVYGSFQLAKLLLILGRGQGRLLTLMGKG